MFMKLKYVLNILFKIKLVKVYIFFRLFTLWYYSKIQRYDNILKITIVATNVILLQNFNLA